MNQENYKEAMTNAEAAVSSGKYEVGLEWFKKALDENPNDVRALTGAGMVCVPIGKFDESLTYFQKAVDADPENGDNYFNLGNAYFFKGDLRKALEFYTEAQMHELSDGARTRLYYHMALICSEKGDVESALINLQKCEDSDKTGDMVTDAEFVSEKISLLMTSSDFDGAEKYAAQWVSLNPGDLRSYMVYFSILMAQGKVNKAEMCLDDAEKYAALDDNSAASVSIERVALLTTKAEMDSEKADQYYNDAYELLAELKKKSPKSKQSEISLMIAEVCMRMGRLDEAIEIANALLEGKQEVAHIPIEENDEGELDYNEVEQMIDRDISEVDERINSGELEDDLGYTAEISYDEDGNEIRIYPEGTFDSNANDVNTDADEDDSDEEAIEPDEKGNDFYDRLYFVLLSCYSQKDDYKNTCKFGKLLKQSSDEYYSYLGRYSEAFSIKKLAEQSTDFSMEEADNIYSETIAFYRTKMMGTPNNHYAAIYRSRMYAEIGKFAKAEEIANLLPAEDTEAVMQYISDCRKEQNMNT